MLKRMKKFVCKAIAVTVALSAVSIPQALFVNAADDTDMIWIDQYSQDFDAADTLTSDSGIVYTNGAAELKDDTAGGKYIGLTPANVTENQSDGIGTNGLWSVFLKDFENADKADSVKLEYKIKFTEIPKTMDVNKWSSYSGMNAKAYCASTRYWAARVSTAKVVLQNKVASNSFTADNDWYTITEETAESNGTYQHTTTLSQNGTVIDAQSQSCKGMLNGYLMGCDATGTGIYVDDIKISYGYKKPENFELTFTDNTADSSFTNDKVAYENITATVKNTEADGKFLRLTSSGDSPSFKIKAFDNAKLAKKVTIEYKARLPKCESCSGNSNTTWAQHTSLNTGIYGYTATGENKNTWAARVRHDLTQANTNAIRGTVNIGEDWFTVKHVLELQKTTDNLTTTVRANDDTNHSNTATYAPSTIGYYDLVSKVSIKEYIDIDDFKVTYEFDEEAKSPEAAIAIYAGDEAQTDLSAVSALTDKVVITFSEAIDVSTVTQDSVYIEDSDGKKVSVSAGFDASGKIYTLTLPSLLSAGSYKVVVTVDVKSKEDKAATAKTTEFTVAAGAALPSTAHSDDYLLDFDDLTADTTPADIANVIYYNSAAIPKIVSGGVAGNALSLSPSAVTTGSADVMGGTEQKWTVAFKNIDANTNADKVVVSYDVKATSTNDLTESSTWGYSIAYDGIYQATNKRAWGVRFGSKKYQLSSVSQAVSQTSERSDWTTISYTYDPKAKTVVSAFGKDGVTMSSEPFSVTGFMGIILQGETHVADILVDNVKVSYIYNAPVLTSDSIVFTDAKGDEQSSLNNIDLLTKKVKIDFGAVMDTSTLTADNVYIAEKGNSGAKVGYIAEYDDGVYTMNLTEALKEETTYTLVVTKGVANVKGDTVSQNDDFSIEFTTGKGKRTADLMSVKVNGSKVTSVSGLTAGSKGKVEIAYSNTTGKTQTLNVIIAYYSGDMLKSAELVKTENIDKSIVEMTYKYDFDILADMTDVTSVKVMSWSDFGEMMPLSDSIDL